MRRDGQRKSKGIYFPPELPESKAWLSLTTKHAPQALTIFYKKRKMAQAGPKGRREWVVTNNGEMQFPYKEAEEKYGWSKRIFSKVLKALHSCGFIDIAEHGGAYRGITTKYSISERWRNYGTALFTNRPWPEDNLQRGYRRPKKRKQP